METPKVYHPVASVQECGELWRALGELLREDCVQVEESPAVGGVRTITIKAWGVGA